MNKRNLYIEVIKRLKNEYPNAKCELNFKNTFQLFVAVQLSAQCTDKKVNEITPNLFQRIKSFKDLSLISNLELEKLIFSTGFYRVKADRLIRAAKMIISYFNGNLPQTMKNILKLPGVARKTANVVLETGFGVIEGIVVDTHVKRITTILGLANEKTLEKQEKILMDLIDKKYWQGFSHYIIWHGRRVCIARRAKCDKCILFDICPKSGIS
jgi:endonuclease-3